ncbi:MAG: isoprenylcysteine carboxylmethyltransferase family protein [Pseudomonadota bacterium]
MLPRWLKAVFIPALLLGIPAIFVRTPLIDWRFWLFFVLGVVLIGSQPDLRYAKLGKEQATHEDRSTLLILQVAAYFVCALSYGVYLWDRRLRDSPPCADPFSIVGAILTTGGMIFRVVAIRTLGRWFTAAVVTQDGHQLIQHGVYRNIRHPSYTGAILFWGFLPFLLDVPLCSLVAWPVLLYAYSKRIGAEETALAAKFGEQYATYQSHTKRLFPFIY